MRFRRLRAGCAALTIVPVLAAPANAGTVALATRANTAGWTGVVDFADGCGTQTVCFHGESLACIDAVSVLLASLPSCHASISASYQKVVNGACAGVGDGTLTYTDSAGSSYSIRVLVVASDGVITYSGRWVDAFGNQLMTVQGTVHSACPVALAPWDGSLSLADV